MRALIAGGTGFLGARLARSLLEDGHQVMILTRRKTVLAGAQAVGWDSLASSGRDDLLSRTDLVVNLTGRSLFAWPWTGRMRRAFLESRVLPGRVLTGAIRKSARRPAVFVQSSGINHYGLSGDPADESTPPGSDFLARLTVEWERATEPVEELGVRRVIVRTAVVLDRREGLLPVIALPVRMFAGGPLGGGAQALPWIHIQDWVRAVRHLIDDQNAGGPYNLVAPDSVTNAGFTRMLAMQLRRPYWLPIPALPMRIVMGGLSDLVLQGRPALPRRLLEAGFEFNRPRLQDALGAIFGRSPKENST